MKKASLNSHCSGIKLGESSNSSDIESDGTNNTSKSEGESFINIPRRRSIARRISDADEESQNAFHDENVAPDGTVWSLIKQGGTSGRLVAPNIFKDASGPTAYAKSNIMSLFFILFK